VTVAVDRRTGADAGGEADAGAPDPAACAVALRGVTRSFGGHVAVDRLSLEVRDGELLALLGPSGCGKTTTLRLIAGFEQPDAGEVHIGERAVAGVPAHRREVCTVFQSYALFPHMTARENVAYGLKQRRVSRRERERLADEALALVRLGGLGHRRPAELSGGMQQRVALARALVLRPRVLLLDEPLGALDLKLRQAMQIELKRLQREVGISFILVTHDQDEAMALADRIAVMDGGRIEQLGTAEEVYDAPATPFAARFVGELVELEGRLDGDAVVLDDGWRVALRARLADAADGDRVLVGVRPEHGRLAADGAAGQVLSVFPPGPDTHVVVGLAAGPQARLVVPRDAGAPAVGAAVAVDWPGATGLLLGPAPTTASTEES
jgi:ABC-type Fe3+/spermidine/putrescine transport system ATPase subunit